MEKERNYPEHDKLSKVKEKSQAIGEFLDWLNGTKGIVLCKLDKETDRFYPANISMYPEATLAEYFHIDLKKLEMEKRQLLDEVRAMNEKLSVATKKMQEK